MTKTRRKIILDYARWTALSALRMAPVRGRIGVYSLIDTVAFDEILDPVHHRHEVDFDVWHEKEAQNLCGQSPNLPIGWAVKLLNVYLKTAAYVGELGRTGLREALHPPIDGGLWSGLKALSAKKPELVPGNVLAELLKRRGSIGSIKDYETYRLIINDCRRVAQAVGCSLLELEQFWLGSATPRAD